MKTRPYRIVDDHTAYYGQPDPAGPLIHLFGAEVWSWWRLPLVAYTFKSHTERLNLGLAARAALAGLKEGPTRIKVINRPTSTDGWKAAQIDTVTLTGDPSWAWQAYMEAAADRITARQPAGKQVYLGHKVGARPVTGQLRNSFTRHPFPPVSDREIKTALGDARIKHDRITRATHATGASTEDLRYLRRHAVFRGLLAPTPSPTRRTFWGAGECRDDFAEAELAELTFRAGPILRSCLHVESPTGSHHTATFVLSDFPPEMDFPTVDPWLAHLDRLPGMWEADLAFELIPAKEARKHIGRKADLARDQARDAAAADVDLPLEQEAQLSLARELEYSLPIERLPAAYGWARIRVDADTPADLASRFEELEEHMGAVGIGVAWPGGHAQTELLKESIPGFPVKHKSWRQQWSLATVAGSLPTAASLVGDQASSYIGYTTGRVAQAVRWSPHTGLLNNKPPGTLLLGEYRAGKSTALGMILADAALAGTETVCLDPADLLARLAELPALTDRIQIDSLLDAAPGSLDPLSSQLIALPDDEVKREKALGQRAQLARDTLTMLARAQIHADPVGEAAMLAAISAEVRSEFPTLMGALDRLAAMSDGKVLAQTLTFTVEHDPAARLAFGRSAAPFIDARHRPVRIITMAGLTLPEATKAETDWIPSERMGAALFNLAAWRASRMLWDTPRHQLKLFAGDEGSFLLGFPQGRRVIATNLREGKRGMATVLAAHAGLDVHDERLQQGFSSKFQFRTSGQDVTRCLTINNVEDTPAHREALTTFLNGECLMTDPWGVPDRMRWEVWYPGLAEVLNTTPTGQRA